MIQNVLNGYGTPAYSVCDKMPWYNEEAEVEYDLDKAKEILETAGWAEGDDGIREKDGVRAEFTMLYPASDSVRQALAEDSKNQLAELGIEVTTEGVDWDTAYTRAESEPLVWGMGRTYTNGAVQHLSYNERDRPCRVLSICERNRRQIYG